MWETGTVTAISAGSAGAVSAVITTAINVMKTRIMLSAADSDQPRGGEQQRVVKEVEAQGKNTKAEIEKA